MPKKIDHEKRKRLIVSKALEVFTREGYQNTSFQLIASECGLSRATVYQYFSHKEDIYTYAAKSVTEDLFKKYVSPQWMNKVSEIDNLKAVSRDFMKLARDHRQEIVNLVAAMSQAGMDFRLTVKHRTARLELHMGRLIRSGIKDHTIKKCKSTQIAEQLLILLESYCFQLVFFEIQAEESENIVMSFLDNLKEEPNNI